MTATGYSSYMPPVGGAKQTLPELTDHCLPRGRKTSPEHDYPASGPAVCRRCNIHEQEAR